MNRHLSNDEIQIANMHMEKKISGSLNNKEIQIKTTMKLYPTPVGAAIWKSKK